AQELAEGVENLQLLYGEDLDGDASPDDFRNASAVTSWDNVVALRVALLVASLRGRLAESDPRTFALLDETVGPFNDGRLRRVVTTTIALRNRVPRCPIRFAFRCMHTAGRARASRGCPSAKPAPR